MRRHREVDAYADKNHRLPFDTEREWLCNDARQQSNRANARL
ncbi:MAG: hypothetical protein ACLU7M_01980 [Mediterraneibacter gnavus]